MDSEPRPSPDGSRSFGDRLAARVRPRRRARSAARTPVGGLAPRPPGSGGRSGCRRWAGGGSIGVGADVGDLTVRPPIDYWPWPDASPK